MKKCPFCAEEIQDAAVKCKHCGEFVGAEKATEKSKNANGCLGCIPLLMVLGVFWMCMPSHPPSDSVAAPPPQVAPPKPSLTFEQQVELEKGKREQEAKAAIKVSGVTDEAEEYSWAIVGQAKNVSANTIYVSLEFDLKDESGAKVGTCMDAIDHLGPGQVWKFKANVLEDRAKKYSTTPHVTVYKK